MSIENRRFVRFLLDIPAVKKLSDGQTTQSCIKQVSIGGCLTEWDDAIYPGDEFRLEVELPNKNYLPLECKVIYRFENLGVGAKFTDISQFEQQLLADIISEKLEEEGLPLLVDPFTLPPKFVASRQSVKAREQAAVESAIASEN